MYIAGDSREQYTLMPPCLEDYISETNETRIIEMIVNKLDFDELGFERAEANVEGRPGYDPRELFKLYVYGVKHKVRSSRRLQHAANINVEVMWLIHNLKPDFRTICRFRADNKEAIVAAYKEFVRILCEIEIISEDEFVGIDGTKVYADNSRANCYTRENLEKRIAEEEEKLKKYMDELEEADKTDKPEAELTRGQLEEAAKRINEALEKHKEIKQQMDDTGKNQICTTDPDALLMNNHGEYMVGHNLQAAVTSGSHIVVGFDIIHQANDVGTIESTVKETKENLGVNHLESTEDKGYEDKKDIENCILNGDIPHVIPKGDKDFHEFEYEYVEEEISDETKNSDNPEDIKKCLQSGVIPTILEGKGIELRIEDETETFEREDTNSETVSCRFGAEFEYYRRNSQLDYYRRADECPDNCPLKCHFHNGYEPPIIYFGLNELETTVKVRRKRKPKIKIRFKPDKEKMRQRKSIAEHPFGTIKHWRDASYCLLRGIEKVRAEFALQFFGYNLTRAINILGFKELQTRLNAI